jgi:mannose-1-phosphate guanylyltransferase
LHNQAPRTCTDRSQYEQEYNVKITFSVETEPLGTAGPLKLAEKILGKDDTPFFVLNSDVICDYPFQQLAAFHKTHGNEGTIVVTKVEEPSKYGVVVHKPGQTSRIDRFVEKPVEFVGNRINAGIYVLNPSVLKRIELRPTSIEQETFPAICADGELHSFDLEGFWMDVGQPKDFLAGTCLYLSSLAKKGSKKLVPSSTPYVHQGNVLVDPTAKIGKNCKIGPNVTIGPNVVVGDGVRLQRCVLLANSKVKDHAWIKSTIVGWNSTIGKWARLENVSVLGDDVTIGDEVYVNGGSILPHKSIKVNVDGKSFIRPDCLQSEARANAFSSSRHHHVKSMMRMQTFQATMERMGRNGLGGSLPTASANEQMAELAHFCDLILYLVGWWDTRSCWSLKHYLMYIILSSWASCRNKSLASLSAPSPGRT